MILPVLQLFALVTLLAVGIAEAAVERKATRLQCMACHSGIDRIAWDPVTGETRDVAIDLPRYRQGDHAKIHCLECHVEGFDAIPHFQRNSLSCMECHPRDKDGAEQDAQYEFKRMQEEFQKTVHYTEYPEQFSCMECHNPHYFKATADFATPRRVLENDNRPCLHCHTADATGPLADPAEPSLVSDHAYLRHPALHLRNTRCIDCHTDLNHPVAHDLLLGSDADQGCPSCHSQQSALMGRLYRYHSEPKQRLGFTNAPMLEDGYVMGATRHVLSDRVTYFLVGGTLLLAIAHATLRFVRRRRRASNSGVETTEQ